MTNYEVLMQYYKKYLVDVKGLSDSSNNHYLGGLSAISRYLTEYDKLNESVYAIDEINDLETVRDYLFNQRDFMEKDKRGNQMHRAGLKNHIRFAQGEEYSKYNVVGFKIYRS